MPDFLGCALRKGGTLDDNSDNPTAPSDHPSCPEGGIPGFTPPGDDPFALDPRVAQSMLHNAAECAALARDTVADDRALADVCDAYDTAVMRGQGVEVPGRPVRTLVRA